jgi:hypothetical protein
MTELEEAKARYKKAIFLPESMDDEADAATSCYLSALEAEVERLRRDAERLDFLATTLGVELDQETNLWYMSPFDPDISPLCNNPREAIDDAIDAAIAAEGGSREG